MENFVHFSMGLGGKLTFTPETRRILTENFYFRQIVISALATARFAR